MHHVCQTLLSIIIPTLNEADHLPVLLGDLKKQKNISLEIIVGDGGSTDATQAVVDASGAQFVRARQGRGAQMNAAAGMASGVYFLFLHADSSMDDPNLLSSAVRALSSELHGHNRIAGHFSLKFMRSTKLNAVAYRFIGEKSSFNRANTTNGDQGLLITREFFRQLGGFDESMPFLEDQRIAEKIRSQGKWITLPGYLKTSARRFEAEGFHRRYMLMSMMMGLHSVGVEKFFVCAPEAYRVQQDTSKLLMSPFFSLICRLIRDEWGWGGTIRIFYLLGRYIRENSWQIFFFLDVRLRPIIGVGRHPFLNFHDRFFGPFTNFKIFNAVTGLICFMWFIMMLSPSFWLVERRERKFHPLTKKRS